MSHVSFVDSKTGEWIQCFETRRGVRCYVRDWVTARFVRMVRDLYLVFSVSYVYCKRKHISRNLIYRLTVSIKWNWRDIRLHRTITSFLDTHDAVAKYIVDRMIDRIISMTQGNVSAEYIGIEHTRIHTESTEDICRCPTTGIEQFVYKHMPLEEFIRKFRAMLCKNYPSFCYFLEEIEIAVRPHLGAFSEIVYPTWCKHV